MTHTPTAAASSQHVFATRHAAQQFANLRSMVDGMTVRGPFFYGERWAVIVAAPSAPAN